MTRSVFAPAPDMPGMSLTTLCSILLRQSQSLDSFYDDPMTDAMGAGDCAVLVERYARAMASRALNKAGLSPDRFLLRVERTCCAHEAQKWQTRLQALGLLP